MSNSVALLSAIVALIAAIINLVRAVFDYKNSRKEKVKNSPKAIRKKLKTS